MKELEEMLRQLYNISDRLDKMAAQERQLNQHLRSCLETASWESFKFANELKSNLYELEGIYV